MNMIRDKKKYIVVAIIAFIAVIVAGILYGKYKKANVYTFPNDIMILHDGVYDELRDVIVSNGNADTSIVRTQAFSLREGSYIVSVGYKSDVDTIADVRGNNSVNFTFDLPATNGNVVEISDSRLNLATPTEKAFISIISKENAGSFELEYIRIYSSNAIYRDYLLNGIVALLVGSLIIIIFLLKDYINITRRQWIEIIVMVLVVTVTMTINYSTEIRRAVDIRGHLLRINGVFTGLLDRQFPVVVYPNLCNEYGEIGVLYPNVLLYFPAILRLFGISLKTAYIYYAVMVNSLTMILGYIGFKKIAESGDVGFVAAVIYYLMPNRMRFNLSWGSVAGAGTAMAFLPLVIAGMYCLIKKNDKCSFLMLPIGLWGMFTSHIVSTLVALFILVVVALVHIKEIFTKERFIKLASSVAVFVLISLESIVPFLDNYFDGFNNEALAWGGYNTYMGEFDRTFSEFSCWYRIVNIVLVVAIAFVIIINYKRLQDDSDKKFYLSFALMAFISVLFITRIVPWKLLFALEPMDRFLGETIQYPDRFLTITEPALVICFIWIIRVLLGDLFESQNKPMELSRTIWNRIVKATKINKICIAIVGLSMVAIVWGCFVDYYSYYTYGEKMIYDNVSGEIDWFFEDYLPEGTEREWYQTDSGNFSNYDAISIVNHSKIWTHISTEYICSTEGEYLEYPLFYYKDYVAYDQNMQPIRVEKGDKNYVRVYLDKCDDVHTINLMYKVKVLYKISTLISIVSFMLLMGYVVNYRKYTLTASTGR